MSRQMFHSPVTILLFYLLSSTCCWWCCLAQESIVLVPKSTSKSLSYSAKIHRSILRTEECSMDTECNTDTQYCAGGLCYDYGTCRDVADCWNPSNEYDVDECLGYIDCLSHQCRTVCSNDTCPPHLPSQDCDLPSCTVVSQCISPVASCVDYNCGSCQALFFDSIGDLICGTIPNPPKNDTLPPTTTTTPCDSDTDCQQTNEYCANGSCLPYGSCYDTIDCYNPSNTFSVTDCLGYMQCQSNGLCQTICDTECPKNVTRANCSRTPCEMITCNEEYTSCIDDYCGGCHAMFFNEQGQSVCISTDDDEVKNPKCSSIREDCSQTTSWWLWTKCTFENAMNTLLC